MASVRQRGKYWSARWRDVDGTSAEEGGFTSRKAAADYAQEQEVLVRKGKKTKPSEMNLTVFEFVSSVWQTTLGVRTQTKKDYERSLNSHILPNFGDVAMRDIRQVDLKAWLVRMQNQGLSERTIEKHLNLLASILKMAVENEYLHKSPFTGWKRGKAQKRHKVTPLTFQQVEGLAKALPPRYQIMVWIGYFTGMRPSEMLGLTLGQLDFDKGTITIDRQLSRDTSQVHEVKGLKTKASERTISFSEELQGLIREHIAVHGLGQGGLILRNRLGGILRYPDAARLFRKAARATGLKDGEGLHQLRHTCVSTLISLNVNMKAIQSWVGHASITETMDTYGHLFTDANLEIRAKFDEHARANRTTPKLRAVN